MLKQSVINELGELIHKRYYEYLRSQDRQLHTSKSVTSKLKERKIKLDLEGLLFRIKTSNSKWEMYKYIPVNYTEYYWYTGVKPISFVVYS